MSAKNDDFAIKHYVDNRIGPSKLQKEADLRAKHPALKKAWEQYQIILSLVLTREDK